MKRFIYSIIASLLFTAFALDANAQTTPEKEKPATGQATQTIKIKVSGITCSGDCKDIQESVEKLEGIKGTKRIGKPAATSTFEITFIPTLVTEKQIRQSVEDTPGCDDPKERPYKVKQVAN